LGAQEVGPGLRLGLVEPAAGEGAGAGNRHQRTERRGGGVIRGGRKRNNQERSLHGRTLRRKRPVRKGRTMVDSKGTRRNLASGPKERLAPRGEGPLDSTLMASPAGKKETVLTRFEPVIGLEVHCQLLTATKIFCGCRNRFGDEPNTNVCPVCLGLPGALPVLSRQAVTLAMRAALATHCAVQPPPIFAP